MKYRIPVQEEIRVWQSVDVYVETEDDIDTVYESLKNGDFVFNYQFDEISNEIMWETCESIQYDYSNTSKGCINIIEEEDE